MKGQSVLEYLVIGLLLLIVVSLTGLVIWMALIYEPSTVNDQGWEAVCQGHIWVVYYSGDYVRVATMTEKDIAVYCEVK